MTHKSNQKKETASKTSQAPPKEAASREDFPVVGIGASAGGLKAFESFFEHMPKDSGAAFIVVQHLPPTRESMLGKILSNKTEMRMVDAQHGMRLEPDTVYVKPSDKDILVSNRTVQLKQADKGRSLPVDRLFRSMARDLGEKAVAVILSGTGSDGTLGIQEVKADGGLVVIQKPEEAEYNGMPDSAMRTGEYDFILPVSEIPNTLTNYFRHDYLRIPSEDERKPTEKSQMQSVLKTVLTRTGHNFQEYKQSTMVRRVRRRMAVNRIDALDAYSRFLRQSPDEVQALFKDLIINVTSFFRDKEAFDKLKEEVIVPLVRERDMDDLVRVWVPGCATGEEAFTIAMLFTEVMDEQEKRLKVKIFGTDINPESIEAAREGFFPENIAEDVDQERLKRYFMSVNGRYKVDSRIREMIIFSVHDITRDPPFSKLNLISCRNLLIYMEVELQQKVLPLWYYGLIPGGYLFLGTSEGVGNHSDLFKTVDRKWKIFQSTKDKDQKPYAFVFDAQWSDSAKKPGSRPHRSRQEPSGEALEHSEEYIPKDRWRSEIRRLLEQTMLARFAPAGLIVDHRNEIQYFHGNTSPYLRPPRGEPRFAILEMVIPELRSTLSTGLNKTRADKRQVVYRDVALRGNGHKDVDISFIPLSSRSTRWDLLLVTFNEKAREASEEPEGSESSTNSQLADLEQELFATRQDLQATIEELETTNEELKSSNEELQANNEELQSTNEELDTSREELQSTNEELETLNAELQRKNEELESVNDDIRNMFANSNVSTVILDTELRVKRFTPMVTALFNLIDKDIGRKLMDISTNLVEYDTLEQDAKGVLNDLNQREREVRYRGGGWMVVRISPYRSGGNVIEGVTITFNDVTELKQKQQEAEEAKLQAEAVLETTRQPLLVLDSGLNVITANHAFYETFQVAKKETQGRRVYSLGNNQWDIPELKRLLEEIIPENSSFRDYEVEHEFPGVGPKRMLLDARRIDRGEDKPYLVLVGFEERRAKGEEG